MRRKTVEPYKYGCPACGVGEMMPGSHGHSCTRCPHFTNEPDTYDVMARDRGEDLKFCHCTWCDSKAQQKNQVTKS